jgi:hypothetical protein
VAHVGPDAVTGSVRVPLPDDRAALDLAAALRGRYCERATMRVVPNDPLKNIEEALDS